MTELGAILTAMVTPFDAEGRVNEEATVRLVHHLVEHGSDGIVVCGSTGEASMLSDDEHVRMVELAVEELKGSDKTVVAGAGSNDTRHAVELTERCTAAGADAILSVTPYYVRPNRRGLVAHYEAVAAATDRPVLLYNIPQRTGLDIDNDLLAELAQIERIDGVKQSNPDNLELIDGLDVYSGNDDLLCDVLELGGAGGICVASHVFGEPMSRMVGEPHRRRQIDGSLRDAYETLAITANPIPIKAALNLLGFEAGGCRLPMVEADEAELAAVRMMLERHGLLESATGSHTVRAAAS